MVTFGRDENVSKNGRRQRRQRRRSTSNVDQKSYLKSSVVDVDQLKTFGGLGLTPEKQAIRSLQVMACLIGLGLTGGSHYDI